MRPLETVARAIEDTGLNLPDDGRTARVDGLTPKEFALLAKASLLAASRLAAEAGEQHVSLWLNALADDMEPGR